MNNKFDINKIDIKEYSKNEEALKHILIDFNILLLKIKIIFQIILQLYSQMMINV